MDFNDEQFAIVTTDKQKVVVYAGPGSGKTRCLVGRLQYLLDSGVKPEDIAAITFTNAAASEIADRLNGAQGMYIGTIHGLAHLYLMSYGINTHHLIENERFDDFFKLVKKNPDCVRPVKYLLLDEGQDSSSIQFEFILDMIQPENWMIFADIKQSIFQWNGAYPAYIFELIKQKDVFTYYLNKNYRCGEKIIDFARQLIMPLGLDYKDDSIPMRDNEGQVYTVEFSADGLIRTIKRRIEAGVDQNSDWFILTRTNAESDFILEELSEAGIACETFKKKSFTSQDLKEKMKANTVKVLTIHVAKGLEAKNVVVIGARFSSPEERCVSYVAATRAKDLLVWVYPKKKPRKKKNMIEWD